MKIQLYGNGEGGKWLMKKSGNKRMVSAAVVLLMACIFTGCGVTSDTIKETAAPNAKHTGTDVRIASYHGRDSEKVKEHLEQYPTDIEKLKETNVFIDFNSFAMRRDRLQQFMASVQRGEIASLDIMAFTVEGDPIPAYIQYNGKNFYCYQSFANDSYASKDAKPFEEMKFKNMYLLDVPNEEFYDIDFTGMDRGFQQFILSNEEIKDYASFQKSQEYNCSIQIPPFDSEKEAKAHVKDQE